MVEVTSSDMALLFEAPDTMFDGARITSKFGSGGAPNGPGRRDSVAGTTEVRVGKRISGGAGKSHQTKILLKTKVVLRKDIVGYEEESRWEELKVFLGV